MFGDVTSANVVGYMGLAADGNRYQTFGSVFMPIAGGETFKLSDMTIANAVEGKYINPNSEYLQHLTSEDATVDSRFTYVSDAWLRAMFKSSATPWDDKYLAAIGWWKYVKGTNYKNTIAADDYTLKLSKAEDREIVPGANFLGNLGNGSKLQFHFPAGLKATTSAD